MSRTTVPCANGCGADLRPDPARKTGMCLPCYRKRQHEVTPSRAAKISAAMKAKFQDPVYAELHRRRTGEGIRDAMANDEAFRQHRQQLGRQVGNLKLGFSNEPAGSDARMASGRKQSATKLRHIPERYRSLYRQLVASKEMTAQEAALHCRAKAAADRAKPLSFEEQLRRVQEGAQIVRKFKPRATDHTFTLGGVATGML
ncbi:hypothetical protein [Sphingobium sp.]|uniref:hypothetical protein n=1 Tax=Sphingobium sp. TaxID=1912891 RepID=UPI003BB73A6E